MSQRKPLVMAHFNNTLPLNELPPAAERFSLQLRAENEIDHPNYDVNRQVTISSKESHAAALHQKFLNRLNPQFKVAILNSEKDLFVVDDVLGNTNEGPEGYFFRISDLGYSLGSYSKNVVPSMIGYGYGPACLSSSDVLYSTNRFYSSGVIVDSSENETITYLYQPVPEADKKSKINIITSGGLHYDDKDNVFYENIAGSKVACDAVTASALYFGKIYNQIRVAIEQGNAFIVFGALESGLYRKNPKKMAELYRAILSLPEFIGKIKVEFAIIDSKLRAVFEDVFTKPLAINDKGGRIQTFVNYISAFEKQASIKAIQAELISLNEEIFQKQSRKEEAHDLIIKQNNLIKQFQAERKKFSTIPMESISQCAVRGIDNYLDYIKANPLPFYHIINRDQVTNRANAYLMELKKKNQPTLEKNILVYALLDSEVDEALKKCLNQGFYTLTFVDNFKNLRASIRQYCFDAALGDKEKAKRYLKSFFELRDKIIDSMNKTGSLSDELRAELTAVAKKLSKHSDHVLLQNNPLFEDEKSESSEEDFVDLSSPDEEFSFVLSDEDESGIEDVTIEPDQEDERSTKEVMNKIKSDRPKEVKQPVKKEEHLIYEAERKAEEDRLNYVLDNLNNAIVLASDKKYYFEKGLLRSIRDAVEKKECELVRIPDLAALKTSELNLRIDIKIAKNKLSPELEKTALKLKLEREKIKSTQKLELTRISSLILLVESATNFVNGGEFENKFQLINIVAIIGIERYIERNASHLSSHHRSIDGHYGLYRASYYLQELKKESPLYQNIVLYALLSIEDSQVFQKDLIIGKYTKAELKADFDARCKKAAGGDPKKLQQYQNEWTDMVNDVLETGYLKRESMLSFEQKAMRLERILDGTDTLIATIKEDLKRITPQGSKASHIHRGIEAMQHAIATSANPWGDILKIADERTMLLRTTCSQFNLFGLTESFDFGPHKREYLYHLLYQALDQFDQNKSFAPKMKNLNHLMIAQEKRRVIEELEKELERLTSTSSSSLWSIFSDKDYSDSKINAYLTLINEIRNSDLDELVGNILKDRNLSQIPVRKNGQSSLQYNKDKSGFVSVRETLESKRLLWGESAKTAASQEKLNNLRNIKSRTIETILPPFVTTASDYAEWPTDHLRLVGDGILSVNLAKEGCGEGENFYAKRIQKTAKLIAKDVSKGDRRGKPITLIPLQAATPEAIRLISKKLGEDWEYTGLTEGPTGYIATLYNKKHLKLDLTKQAISVGPADDSINGHYRINFFKTKEGSPFACANMDLNANANYPLVLHRITEAMVNTPGKVVGNAKHQVEGQVGACVVPPQDKGEEGADYRVSDVIFDWKNGKLSLDPTQVALDFQGDEVHVTLPEPSESEKKRYPIISFSQESLRVAGVLVPLAEALNQALQPKTTFPQHLVNYIIYHSRKNPHQFTADQITALINLLNGIGVLLQNPKANVNKGDLINKVAIAGIKRYLACDQPHLSPVEKCFDGARGIDRAKVYLKKFESNKRSPLYKEILLYALLASLDGKTLQRDMVVGEPLKIKIKANLHEYTLKAAGGDEVKAAAYRLELDKIVGEMVESVNMDGVLPKALSKRVNRLERMWGKSDQLINNIMLSIQSLNPSVPETENNFIPIPHVHRGIEEMQGKPWNKILEIAQYRSSPIKRAFSRMNFFGASNARDPIVDRIYSTLANFDRIRLFNPKIENLPQAMIAYAKLTVLEKFEAEIARLMKYHPDHLLIKPGLVRDSLPLPLSSLKKIEAYRNLFKAIVNSDKDETVQDVLNQNLNEVQALKYNRILNCGASTSEEVINQIANDPLNGDAVVLLASLQIQNPIQLRSLS